VTNVVNRRFSVDPREADGLPGVVIDRFGRYTVLFRRMPLGRRHMTRCRGAGRTKSGVRPVV